MAWNGNNDSITCHSSHNYMFGEKIFILDEITSSNCAYLIGDLTTFVLSEANIGKKLIFIINSPGGDAYVMMNIIGLINMAKLNNIQVYTFVIGMAGSAASLIAVQGDQRYMSNISRHFVHFGSIVDITTKHSEIEKTYYQNKEYAENLMDLYVDACDGKLTKDFLKKLQSDERGFLNAKACLKYGLCDDIIEDDLNEKLLQEQYQKEFNEGYNSFLKTKKQQKRTPKVKEENDAQ